MILYLLLQFKVLIRLSGLLLLYLLILEMLKKLLELLSIKPKCLQILFTLQCGLQLIDIGFRQGLWVLLYQVCDDSLILSLLKELKLLLRDTLHVSVLSSSMLDHLSQNLFEGLNDQNALFIGSLV